MKTLGLAIAAFLSLAPAPKLAASDVTRVALTQDNTCYVVYARESANDPWTAMATYNDPSLANTLQGYIQALGYEAFVQTSMSCGGS